ncbi:trypsin [Pseudonocardiaceae bacterium YIM PH 21723]|nr:trypsin [Pseudonocardiaceae bacterium YIM PH 21723]
MFLKRVLPAAAVVLAAVAGIGYQTDMFSVHQVAGPKPIIGGTTGTYAPAARLTNDWYCTATLISPEWILTARHCVTTGAPYTELVSSPTTFSIGSTSDTGGIQATGTQITIHPSADLALVKLDHAVSSPVARLASANPALGASVSVYGWGSIVDDTTQNGQQSPVLKTATSTYQGPGVDVVGGSSLTLWAGNGAVAGGDSGGPAVANGVQVGVASTSNRSTTSNYTSVATYRSWITQVSGV